MNRHLLWRNLLGIEERAEEIGYDLVLFTSTGTSDGRRRIYRDGTNRLNLADGTNENIGTTHITLKIPLAWLGGHPHPSRLKGSRRGEGG